MGQKPPLRQNHVWAIRTHLQLVGRPRDLALFNLALDSKLRGCDIVSIRVDDIAPHGYALDRATIRQKKTGRPVKFEITENTRDAIDNYLQVSGKKPGEVLFDGGGKSNRHLTTRHYARLLSLWISRVGLDPSLFGTHSMRRTKATLIYRRPGNLRAVYRGNGIPLPWGNMTMVTDPCQHWAVFRMFSTRSQKPTSQISVLRSGDDKRLYTCQSIRSNDAAGNSHVLCAGVDLAPALRAQNIDPLDTINTIENSCNAGGGSGEIPDSARLQLESVGKILNIGWIEEGCKKPATIICPRSSTCPRDKNCLGKKPPKSRSQIDQIRDSLSTQPIE